MHERVRVVARGAAFKTVKQNDEWTIVATVRKVRPELIERRTIVSGAGAIGFEERR